MRTKIRYLIAGMILLLAVPAMSSGTGGFLLDTAPENTAESNPFEFLAEATRSNIGPGQNSVIAVSVRIASGHKLYASKMGIEPGDVPGVVFGKLETPDSVEKEEPNGKTARFYVGDVSFFLPVSIDPSVEIGPLTVPLTVLYQGCSDTRCFFPQEKQLTVSLNIEATAVAGTPPVLPVISENTAGGLPEENPYERAARRFGLLGVLAAAFMWGVLASMTPCIYPMIPVTMSVIGAVSAGSPARGFTLSLIYVLGMSLVYAAFGIAAAWSGSLFGALSDHPAVRIVVSGVFVLLALSLFDLFHIRMPSWVASRLGGKFGGGVIGVFLTGAACGSRGRPVRGAASGGASGVYRHLGRQIPGISDHVEFCLWAWGHCSS